MKKLLIPIVTVLLLLCGCNKQQAQEQNGYSGLVVEAPSAATVTVYPGSVESISIIPDQTEREGGITRYCFSDAVGIYYYTVSAVGCYTQYGSVYIEPEMQGKETLLQITPEQMAGDGWEPESYYTYTTQLMANKPDDPALWPEYPEAFSTPSFDDGHAAHQTTTQQEMEDYIASLDDEEDRMYTFVAGQSAYGLDIPVVIFTTTDLSGVQTLEEAAALLRDNGKLTIHYQGFTHGNEPAGGEAALGMIKRLDDQGDSLTDKVNIYVIPRVNPDGAKSNTRKTVVGELDMNRDMFQLQAAETRVLLKTVQLLDPTVVIDSHEYSFSTYKAEELYADLQISPGFIADPDDELAKLSLELTQYAFDKLEQQNLNYKYYLNMLNSENVTTVRDYFSRTGKLTFVLESKGIKYGNVTLGRRTVAHMVAAWEIMTQVAQQPEVYLQAQQRWLDATVAAGMTYEEEDIVILQRQKTKHPEYDLQLEQYNLLTGDKTLINVETTVNDKILRSRPAPTAYVIPAEEEWTQKVLDYMELHGISYHFMPGGFSLKLQQYTGSTEYAELTEEQSVYFPKGAYMFRMSQEQAVILSMLMEPDCADMEGSTLAQMGVIPCEDEKFPLYRFIRDFPEI